MGHCIIKVAPDEDLYMEWSSVVDNCVAIGTREEMERYLANKYGTVNEYGNATALTWADEHGTSDHAGRGAGHWDDDAILVHNLTTNKMAHGHLAREHFSAYANLILAGQEDEAEALIVLEEYEDD